MWKLGLWPRYSFYKNICFQFSVLVLCSVVFKQSSLLNSHMACSIAEASSLVYPCISLVSLYPLHPSLSMANYWNILYMGAWHCWGLPPSGLISRSLSKKNIAEKMQKIRYFHRIQIGVVCVSAGDGRCLGGYIKCMYIPQMRSSRVVRASAVWLWLPMPKSQQS